MSRKINYLIDSENSGNRWLKLYEEQPNARFYVFYTKNSPHVGYGEAERLCKAKNIKFIPCNEGTNALDFQLSSYLGYLTKGFLGKKKNYIIASNDAGYDPMIKFWADNGVAIKRQAFGFGPVNELPVFTPSYEQKKDFYTVVNCIGPEDGESLKDIFKRVYGDADGARAYDTMKKINFEVPQVTWGRKTKIRKFLEVLFRNNGKEYPESMVSLLTTLTDISTDMGEITEKCANVFGEEPSKDAASVIAPFIGVVNGMKA